MTDKVYSFENIELLVKDRERLTSLRDQDFMEELELLAGWPTNLYRLYQVDPTETITLDFPTDRFMEDTKGLSSDSDEFVNIFCETMECLLRDELQKRHIDLSKLHYGIGDERGIKYEYCHITQKDYKDLLNEHKDLWYRIVCAVPYRQIHKDTFFVQQSRLHEFFAQRIYECYDGKNREIVHIEPISEEEAREEIKKIENTVKRHEDERFRTDEFLQTQKKPST